MVPHSKAVFHQWRKVHKLFLMTASSIPLPLVLSDIYRYFLWVVNCCPLLPLTIYLFFDLCVVFFFVFLISFCFSSISNCKCCGYFIYILCICCWLKLLIWLTFKRFIGNNCTDNWVVKIFWKTEVAIGMRLSYKKMAFSS